jgi:hypothetical protein
MATPSGQDAAGDVADSIFEACTDDGSDDCPPCRTVSGRTIPVGTKGYRPLDEIPDDQMQHGVYGAHHNIFTANQAPKNSAQPCRCFWKKEKYVLKPHELTDDMVPVEPFIY